MSTGIPLAVLMCHAPIVLPEIGGARASSCASSTAAMIEAGRAVVEARPDVVVLVSPHTPRPRGAFGVVDAIAGSFARFGVPEVALRLPTAHEAVDRIELHARSAGVSTRRLPEAPLDHGALVPLHFLVQAGWQGPTVVLSFPADFDGRECSRMGEAIARSAAESGQRWVLVASGDMSHRLVPGAPAGFDPRAQKFDAAVTDAVSRGEYRATMAIDPELRDLAAEDVIDSLEVAAAAVAWDARGHRVLSYEGPFGVGYLVAILHRAEHVPSIGGSGGGEPGTKLVALARSAIAAHLSGDALPPLGAGGSPARGVFVTLWGPPIDPDTRRELRGCVGHIEPLHPTLEDEVATCAVASATRDVRMVPIRRDELSELDIEVKVLGPLERVDGPASLDPARYGVLVTQGRKRGVLLPKVEGVETVEEQLGIACRKGGVDRTLPYEIHRFTAETFSEETG